MREQFAEGRAALRANLELPNEASVHSDKAAPSVSVIDSVSPSAAVLGIPNFRSTFGSTFIGGQCKALNNDCKFRSSVLRDRYVEAQGTTMFLWPKH